MLIDQVGPEIEIHTPAKLNLFLEVLFRREDGFHEIETLMTSISIYDTIYFSTRTDHQLRLTCGWAHGTRARSSGELTSGQRVGDLPEGGDNIVLQAVDRLQKHSGVRSGASIRLVKRIPSSSGLGGASSDAAAALVAANSAWKLGCSRDELRTVAAEIGSDVPFFLDCGSAMCRGRGERIQPVVGLPRMHFAVVRPPEGLSTPRVFKQCRPPADPVRAGDLLDALRFGCPSTWSRHLMNRLQETAERMSPWIQRIRRVFDRVGCLGHQMSGSGSCYFGICRNGRDARRIARILRANRLGLSMHANTVTATQLGASLR